MAKWIAFQPLIGGMMIGAEKAWGCPPAAILSFEGFFGNDRHYLRWIRERGLSVPYIVLGNEGGIPIDIMDWNKEDGYTSLAKILGDDKETLQAILEETMNNAIENVHYVASVPVCAGLSGANRQSNGSCKQNDNMLNLMRFSLEIIRPKIGFIAENAPALFTGGRGAKIVQDKITGIASENGYAVSFVKTNTAIHGIPQSRHRSFFYAVPGNRALKIEKSPELQFVPFVEWIAKFKDDPNDTMHNEEFAWKAIMGEESFEYIYNRFGSNWRQFASKAPMNVHLFIKERNGLGLEFIQWLKETNSKHLKTWQRRYDKCGHSGIFSTGTASRTVVAPTLYTRTARYLAHPFKDRLLTARECMRLMGMPDNMNTLEDIGDDYSCRVIASQNVPSCTAEWACKELSSTRAFAEESVYFFDNFKAHGGMKMIEGEGDEDGE